MRYSCALWLRLFVVKFHLMLRQLDVELGMGQITKPISVLVVLTAPSHHFLIPIDESNVFRKVYVFRL